MAPAGLPGPRSATSRRRACRRCRTPGPARPPQLLPLAVMAAITRGGRAGRRPAVPLGVSRGHERRSSAGCRRPVECRWRAGWSRRRADSTGAPYRTSLAGSHRRWSRCAAGTDATAEQPARRSRSRLGRASTAGWMLRRGSPCVPRAAAAPRRSGWSVYFAGLLVLTGAAHGRAARCSSSSLITGFFHASVLRPWPLAVARRRRDVGRSIHVADRRASRGRPSSSGSSFVGGHRDPDGRDRVRRRSLGERLSRAERAAAAGRSPTARPRSRRTRACTPSCWPRRGRPASSTSGSGWRARSTTPSRRASPASSPSSRRPSRPPTGRADWHRHVDNAPRLARESLTEARRSVQASRPERAGGAPAAGGARRGGRSAGRR